MYRDHQSGCPVKIFITMQQNWLDAQQKGQEKVMKNKGGKIYLCS
jgi:hypothetical protein